MAVLATKERYLFPLTRVMQKITNECDTMDSITAKKLRERNGGNELKHIIVAQITNNAQKNTGNTDKGRQE